MGLDHDASVSSLQLVLGLALTSSTQKETITPSPQLSNNKVDDHFSTLRATPKKPYFEAEPSLTLGLSGESYLNHVVQVPKNKVDNIGYNKVYCEDPLDLSTHTSPLSVVSSVSSGRVKRERELSSEEIDRVSSRVSDEDEDGTNARKKLRLSKEQSALLEESFKQHSTLNPVMIIHLYSHISVFIFDNFFFMFKNSIE